jgi:hypothetical protein
VRVNSLIDHETGTAVSSALKHVNYGAMRLFQHLFKPKVRAAWSGSNAKTLGHARASGMPNLICAMRYKVVRIGYATDSVSIDSREQYARQSH